MKHTIAIFLFLFLSGKAWGQIQDSVYWQGVVDSLKQQSRQYAKNSNFSDALSSAGLAARMAEDKFGSLNTQTASAISLLGQCYLKLGQYDSAQTKLETSLLTRQKLLGEENLETLGNLIELGALERLKSQLAKAETHLLHAKALLEKTNQTKDTYYRVCLGNLAEVNSDKGNFDQAESLYLQVGAIKAEKFGKKSASYGATLHDLGAVYWLSGRLEAASFAFKTALDIFLDKLGKYHPFTANAYGNLGRVFLTCGDYAQAETMINTALDIRKKLYGESSVYYVYTLQDLSNIYDYTGKTVESIAILEQARSILINLKNTDDQYFGVVAANLGANYLTIGDYKKAVFYLTESKEAIAKVLGKEGPYYATCLYQLAEAYRIIKQYDEAERIIAEELSVWDIKQNKSSIEYGQAMIGAADFYIEKSSPEKAAALLTDAKTRMEASTGKDNLIYIGIIERLAVIAAKTGDDHAAESLIVESNERERALIKREANAFIEKDLKRFIEMVDHSSDILCTFLSKTANPQQSLSGTAYDNALFHKGYLLQGIQQMRLAASFADDSIQQIYDRWKGYHRQLSQQYTLNVSEQQNTNSIEEKANNLEKILTNSIAGFGRARQQVTWKSVQTQLKPDEAAIEFVKFQDPDQPGKVYYGAIALLPLAAGDLSNSGTEIPPKFVTLFRETELSSLLRETIGGNNFLKINTLYATPPRKSAQKSLYELIWQPLESLLSNTKTVYCAPSGLLHRLNLAAIPSSDGKPFGNHHQLVVLGSTRQLVVQNITTTTSNAYLAGGIRYSSDSTAIAQANQGFASRNIEAPETLAFQPDSSSRGGVLDYLPATAKEVREIGQTLNAAGFKTKVDTGFYATEESFRQLGVGSPSPRIIHLATHGYFFPDPVTADGKRRTADGSESVFKMSEHPMIRSGLIMAGAKEAWITGKHPIGQEDGILTAYEISQMNLSGTELVVLSACETGLGDIVGNEGVYGLQRSFKIAGAKYLIMSLWKVDDRSTQEFMSAFYRHWLTEKQTVPQAFRNTQRDVRAKHSGAYDWAGFILIE